MDTPGRLNISGIVLHVKEYAGHPAETLSYRKAASRTISVGRKPSQGSIPDDPERALFRCPVVSRRHAKITFTEYGNVYITDLHSHHGTHILRPDELVSTPLKPEVPTVLANGDLITFGKTVGRESYLVRPVVVRIELIFGRDASPRAPSPLPRPLIADDSSPDKACARSNSGRYGVYPPSPESSPSTSDGDSDVQEISPSSPPGRLPSLEHIFSRSSSMSLQNGRLRLLQSILPPIHAVPESPPPADEPFFEEAPSVLPAAIEEEDMDLSSSRSSSPAENGDADVTFAVPYEEPPVVGAWPGTPFSASEPSEDTPERASEPRGSPPAYQQHSEVIEISDDDYGTPSPPPAQHGNITNSEVQVVDIENIAVEDMPAFLAMKDALVRQVQSIVEASAAAQELAPGEAQVLVQDDESVPAPPSIDAAAVAAAQAAEILVELNAIRATREEDEAAFSAHVQQTRDRLNALDGQMLDTHARLSSRDDHLKSIQSRLQGLGTLVSDLQERSTAAEREAARVEELVQQVGAAKDALKETCELQRETRERMLEELDAVKALRAEAAAVVAEAKLAAATATTASNTLKRKRDEMDAEEPIAAASDVDSRIVAPLPSKRRKTMQVAAQVAQTVTIASVGAVAAWAALAFS